MRRPTTRARRTTSLVAVAILLAAVAAACGDDSDASARPDLGELVDPTTTTTEPPTTTTEATTTTTEARRVFTPTEVATVMLSQADVPGYGPPIVTGGGERVDFVTDPPECGATMDEIALDHDPVIELSSYFDSEDAYTTVTQAVAFAPDHDHADMLDRMREAIAGPCATPFHTDVLGWATGTLTYVPGPDPDVGEDALSYTMQMDIVQEGVHVNARTEIVVMNRGPFLVTVQVLTGGAADGSFVGPEVTREDAIAYAGVMDERARALLGE